MDVPAQEEFVKKIICFVPAVLLVGTQLAMADVVSSVGPGAFGATATLIDFSTLSNDDLITTQYAGLGLTVSGGLYADIGGPSGAIFGTPSASNFLPSNPGNPPYDTIVFTFSTPMVLIGMDEISNPGSFNISTPGGALAYSSSLTPGFVGFEDLTGFTSVTLTVTGAANNAFGIANLEFQSSVPEPASAPVLGGALLLIGWVRLRARRRTATD
jgi:hypothetical protein